MSFFRSVSIRNKLLGIILLTAIVSLVCGFTFVLLNDVRTFKRDLAEQATLIARTAADYSVSDLAFGDQDAAAKTLAKLSAIPGLEAAFLYDTEGKPFSSFARDERPTPPLPGEPLRFDANRLHVVQPVVEDGERYGTLYVQMSTAALTSKIRRHLGFMGLFLLLMTGVAIGLAYRLEKIISRPILGLAAAAKQISENHDYTIRVPKPGEDELGVLCDGFNDMLSQIERRERERDEADQRTREKSQFLANMSHELRTPLNAIIGFSEVLATRLKDRAEVRELKFLDNIYNSGQHLLGIVNDILDLSKVEAGKMEITPERFSIPPAIEGVCTLMKGVSSRRNIALVIDTAPDLPPVHADPGKIKQVLYNLLSNAVKFSPENSTVAIQARALPPEQSPLGEQTVAISVIDQGIGIERKNHDLIFQEFRQVDGTMSRQFEGTGLGLALVRKLLHLHRGIVTVDSELGKGSTFTVYLPVEFRGNERTDPISPLEAPAGPLVLVVETDDAAWRAIDRQLNAAGFRTFRATDGEDVLRLARRQKPSVITLDLVLPGIDGWDVLKALKADPQTARIPVVITSVIESRDLAFAIGADEYLLKPVESEELIAALLRFTEESRGEKHILVIDDDRSFHEMVEARVAPQRIKIEHAYDGEEGLALAKVSRPAVIVLDLMMARVDGFEVALRLKEDARTAGIPVIVVTAKDLTASDRARLAGKVTALVQKGEGLGRLTGVITDLMDRQRVYQNDKAKSVIRESRP